MAELHKRKTIILYRADKIPENAAQKHKIIILRWILQYRGTGFCYTSNTIWIAQRCPNIK